MDSKSLFSNELIQFIQETVKTELASQEARKTILIEVPIKNEMDLIELSNYLPTKPPLATIYAWSSKGLIPHQKLGRRLIFKKNEIDEWLELKRVKTVDEIKMTPVPFKKR
jgi:hypothetical protein